MPIHTNQRQRETTEEEAKPQRGPLPRFGVALFDESKDSGWASLPDGPAFRFRQPQDLRNDCVWICSMEHDEYIRRWRKTHHLRASGYVSKLKDIAADFGVRVDGEGKWGVLAQRACAILAPTVHRAMVIATQVYNWTEPAQMLQADTLAEDIRLALVEPPPVRHFLHAPLKSAYQSYSSPSWSSYYNEPDSLTLTLRYNRLEYAKRILATRVPDGAWNYFGRDEVSGFSYSLDKALDPEQPCLVNATVEFGGRDEEIATLCAFGAQPNKRSVLRSWISQPELMWLHKHAHVHINAVRVSEWAKPLPPKILLPELLTSDPLFEFSVPAGLVAEAHWKAVASPVHKPSVEGKKEYSAWAVWLRAADRALSFQLALAAHEQKFYVQGYGSGAVTLRCPRARLKELLDFAMEHNIAHPAFRSIFEEQGLIPREEV